MKLNKSYWYCVVFVLWLANTASAQPPPPQPYVQPNDVQILTGGPVHEAFAQPFQPVIGPSVEVLKLPPPPIQEIPAAVRPDFAGREPEWIPGYWAWENDRFVWVSGIWRYPPPGMRWLPGHWVRTERGCIWSSGFWLPVNQNSLTYLPEPPQQRSLKPNSPQPNENLFWVPGRWDFQNGQWVWREGFWSQAQNNWVWNPSHYVWTPRGYVFLDGGWDYRPEDRGVLFAPVQFTAGYRGVYQPVVLIDTTSFFVHLFFRPSYGHYYFGNYYGVGGGPAGFYPWVSLGIGNSYYDPLLTFYGVARRADLVRYGKWHDHYVRNPNARPPRQWSKYPAYLQQFDGQQPQGGRLLVQADQALQQKGKSLKKLNPGQMKQYNKSIKYYQDLAEQRVQMKGPKNGKPGNPQSIPKFVPPGKSKKNSQNGVGPNKYTPPPQIHRPNPGPPRIGAPPNSGKGPGPGKGKGNSKGKGKGKGKGR